MNQHAIRGIFILVVIVVSATYPLAIWRTYKDCTVISQGRAEGARREDALRDLLRTARDARASSAALEHGAQRRIDLRAAHAYEQDLKEIHHLPPVACSL